jgi:hypothetical protein
MKKTIWILMTGILVLSGFEATASSDYELEKMTLSFSRLSVNEEGSYAVLELDGADSVLTKGNHFIVPACVKTFTFPFGTKILNVECISRNIHKEKLCKALKVAPEPIIVGTPCKVFPRGDNAPPVVLDTWYEYDVGTGLDGRERRVFVKVEVFPVQYYPHENIVEWAEEVEIVIKFKQPVQPLLFDEEYALLVITPAMFSDELEELVVHKNSRGVSTKLVTLDDVYNSVYFPAEGRDNQEKIKYFIKNAIENWGIRFVLLVGGSYQFPVRYTYVFISKEAPEPEIFVSDLYYADIYDSNGDFCSWDSNGNNLFGEYNWENRTDDVDLYPDVYLGRLACTNSKEVSTCVDKIITYENSKAYTKDWFNHLVVIGGDTFPGDDEAINEGEYVNEVIIDIMDGFVPTRIWASNGEVRRATNIDEAINKGAGFVDFSGHGNPWLWSTHPHENEDVWLPVGGYSNEDIKGLVNGDKLPMVITGACSTSKFNAVRDCFGWSFLSNPNGGGIISCGATALGYADWGKNAANVCIEKMCINMFKAYKQQGAITFGEMWGKAINNYILPNMDKYDYKTVEEWEPFGDPSLSIAAESKPPLKPAKPSGPISGTAGVEYTYSSTTTDPEGDDIYYLFDWGDGETSGWIGPYPSDATVEATHAWDEGDYQIRVKAKDEHGALSEWSDPLSISMPKNKQLPNQRGFLEWYPGVLRVIEILIEILNLH